MHPPRKARRRRLAWLLLGVAGAACTRGPRSDVSDSLFVATMADLRRVQRDTATDSASRAAARAGVLQRRGLTPARLEQAARAFAEDPERANKIFQAIARKASDAPPPPLAPAVLPRRGPITADSTAPSRLPRRIRDGSRRPRSPTR